jgi:hypothetical protein
MYMKLRLPGSPWFARTMKTLWRWCGSDQVEDGGAVDLPATVCGGGCSLRGLGTLALRDGSVTMESGRF